MKVDPPDISNSHRVGAPERSDRPILVKFMNYQIHSRVFKAKKNWKTLTKEWIETPKQLVTPTTTQTKTPVTAMPYRMYLEISLSFKIYINEDLCKGRAYLSFKARQIKNADGIADTWTFNGNIMVKDKKNNIHKVTRMSDLLKFDPRR